jgi:hypothetical protein
MSCRTLCEVPDLSALLRPPTAPHLAAFILPSVGRVASCLRSHRRTCESIRHSAKEPLRPASRDINCQRLPCLLSALRLQDQARALVLQPDRGSAYRPTHPPVSLFSRGTMRLDQPRSRSSGVSAGADRVACGPGVSVSNATSLASKYASFGMSKFGALPFSTVARTASANRGSGRSHEPR